MQTTAGLGDSLSNALRLQLAMKGLRCKKPKSADVRLPITPYILKAIKTSLKRDPYNHNNIMLWAACCLAIFAFLRSGELMIPTMLTFDTTWHLTPQGIMVDNKTKPTRLFVRIKGSNTDQTCQSITLCVGRTYNELCPVAAVLAYLARRTMKDGPWLSWDQGNHSPDRNW